MKYIYVSNVLNVDLNDFYGLMYLYIRDLEFDDGKIYSGEITIKMKRYFDINVNVDTNIDEIQDIVILRKQLKTCYQKILVIQYLILIKYYVLFNIDN